MNRNELKELISFPLGIPSIYHIRLGLSPDEIDEYQSQIDKKETDNYNLNDFLKKYDVFVEMIFNDDMKVIEISISIPVEELSERDLNLIHDAFAYNIDTVEKKFSITTDAADSIKELESFIHTDLFDVEFSLNENHNFIVITFSTDDEVKIDMLRCLSIISQNEKDFVNDMVKYIDNHQDYWAE